MATIDATDPSNASKATLKLENVGILSSVSRKNSPVNKGLNLDR